MFKLYLIYINWYWDGYDEGYKGIGQWSKNDDDAPYYPFYKKNKEWLKRLDTQLWGLV